jgi:hypothetical protein
LRGKYAFQEKFPDSLRKILDLGRKFQKFGMKSNDISGNKNFFRGRATRALPLSARNAK